MKNNYFIILVFSIVLSACNTRSNFNDETKPNNWITLHSDSVNVVKLTDTLVIYSAVCRGCEYEKSTEFSISDSLGIVELKSIETIDNNPSNMDGGSINKNLIIVPRKTGQTMIKLYKFWNEPINAEDSAIFTTYIIEVKK